MRGSRVIVLLLLGVVLVVLAAWLALSRPDDAQPAAIAPKPEVHEKEITKTAALAAKPESAAREEALAPEPFSTPSEHAEGALLRVRVFDAEDTSAKLDGVIVELFDAYGVGQKQAAPLADPKT